ncbi:hypothetical protein [Nocardiopsis ansamitocini]|uniref:Uncharacterized protein n=1 Tax=Nocardiopsis ansamitocini TaxID=1670832 RepID=A0A9W6UG46_9ACTN|nr:hypothetical protein [Nocardiopsis ansamitocini]GLU46546.1 hypothetical protein Nans01_08970 [Nocardiopsis ansamitocini]
MAYQRGDRQRAGARLLALLLVAGGTFLGAPVQAASADAVLDQAVAALDDPGLYTADATELDPGIRELAAARLADARTPVRAALLGRGDASVLVADLAEKIGDPGVYVVTTEERSPTGATTIRTAWQVVGGGTDPDDLDHHFTFYPGGTGAQLIALPDVLDDDLLPAVREAADTETVYIHPAVAALPGIDAERIAQRYNGINSARVAVLPATVRDNDAFAEALLDPLEPSGTALLLVWEHNGFRPVPASGSTGPDPAELGSALSGGSVLDADDVEPLLTEFAALAGGDVLDSAARGLADSHLYLHPLAVHDVDEAARDRIDTALAELDEPVRVAVLPRGAAGFEAGAVNAGEPAVAAAVARDLDQPVVVYGVDGLGEIRDESVHGSLVGGAGPSGAYDLDTAAFFGRSPDGTAASLSGLLEQLGAEPAHTPTGQQPADDPQTSGAGWVVAAVVASLALGAPLLLLSALRLRQARRRRIHERQDEALMEQMRAEEAQRVTAIRSENENLITSLGEELAAAAPAVVDPPRKLQRHLREYEKLKERNRTADDIDTVVSIRSGAQRTRAAVEEWNRRQRS